METMAGGLFAILLTLGVRSAATLAAERALRRIANPVQLRVWRYLAAGLLIWALADAVTVVQWVVTDAPPVAPTLRDLLQIAGYFGVLAAILRFHTAQQESFGRIRDALDVGILGVGVLSLAWLIFLGPAVDAGYLPLHIIFWLAIRPVLDLVLMLVVVRLLIVQTRRQERHVLLLLLAAFGVFFLSDLAASMRGIYRYLTTPSLVEAGWMTGSLVLGLVFRSLPFTSREADSPEPGLPGWRIRLELLFPLVFTYAVAGFLLFEWWYSGSLDWVGVGGAALLIALMFARQGVIAGQQELRQFAALVSAAADMAFICDMEGTIRLANPSLRQALGLGSGEAPLQSLQEVLADLGADEVRAMLAAAQGGGWSGEVTFRGVDGRDFPATLELRPLRDAQRSRTLIAATAHDLAEIRKREDDLRDALAAVDLARDELSRLNLALESKVEDRTRQLEATVADLARLNEELKALDRLKSEFVALVSHELRAPLTNIRSGIELLVERDRRLTGHTLDSLELIQAETDRLTLFVEAILDLSAIDAGRVQLEQVPVAPREVMEATTARFSQARGRLKLDPVLLGALPDVCADRRALESVLYHLVDNALKYAPEGQVEIAAREADGMLQVEISDAGPGIPPDQREKVFEMFHRLDSRDAREVYGHGLGLPMARRLVEAMGGSIGISASAAGGTLVTFTLPLAGGDPLPSTALNRSPADGGKAGK